MATVRPRAGCPPGHDVVEPCPAPRLLGALAQRFLGDDQMRTRLLHRQFEAPGIDAIQHVATAHALVVVHRDLGHRAGHFRRDANSNAR